MHRVIGLVNKQVKHCPITYHLRELPRLLKFQVRQQIYSFLQVLALTILKTIHLKVKDEIKGSLQPTKDPLRVLSRGELMFFNSSLSLESAKVALPALKGTILDMAIYTADSVLVSSLIIIFLLKISAIFCRIALGGE